jgi:hypothetical protein
VKCTIVINLNSIFLFKLRHKILSAIKIVKAARINKELLR